MAGARKASVFPLPVAAMPMTSLPSRRGGQHWLWIGDGAEKPLDLI